MIFISVLHVLFVEPPQRVRKAGHFDACVNRMRDVLGRPGGNFGFSHDVRFLSGLHVVVRGRRHSRAAAPRFAAYRAARFLVRSGTTLDPVALASAACTSPGVIAV